MAGSRLAFAAEGVGLEVGESCQRVDRAQLERLLNIEQRRDVGVRRAHVGVRCEGDAVTLVVEAQGEQASPKLREFRADDVAGEVGARVLALAAIELWETAPPEPEPPPPQVQQARVEPVVAPPRVAPPAVRLMAVGTLRSFALEQPLLGGGIAVDYLRLARLGLRLEFDVGFAERSYELGRAKLQLTTFSAQAGYLALHDSWSARAYAGYRFGSARISGESSLGSDGRSGTVAGACGGPLVSLGLGLRSGGWLSAELVTEAGLVSFPIRGDVEGHAPLAFDDYWLGLSLNVGALL